MPSASDIRAGGATVEIGANLTPLQQALNQGKAKLQGFTASLQTLAAAVGFASVTNRIVGWVQSFADAGREMYLLSQRTGASVESLDALKKAAAANGVQFEDVTTGIMKMQKFLHDLAQTGNQSNESLSELGLTLNDLEGLDPTQQLTLIGERIAALGNAAARTGAATAIFGRGGANLLPALPNLRQAQQDASGNVMSAEDAKRAFDLSQAFNKLNGSVAAVGKTIGSVLAPAFTPVLTAMTKIVGNTIGWLKNNQQLVRTVGAVIGVGATLAAALTAIVTGIAVVKMIFGGLIGALVAVKGVFLGVAGVFGLVLSPIGLVVAAIVGIGAYFASTSGVVRSVVSRMSQAWSDFSSFFNEIWGGITDALKAGDLGLAWKVAVAGMERAWLEFNNRMEETLGFSFIDAINAIKVAWVEMLAFLETTWATTSAAITQMGEEIGTSVAANAAEPIAAAANNSFVQSVEGTLRGIPVVGDALQSIGRAGDRFLGGYITAAATSTADTRAASAEQGRGAQDDANARRQTALTARLAEIEAGRVAGRNQIANAPGLDESLVMAQIDLENALEEASIAAAQAEAERNERNSRPIPGEGTLDDLGGGTKGAAIGTFSASAAAGLVGGGASPVVNALGRIEEVNREQAGLLREVRDAQPRVI